MRTFFSLFSRYCFLAIFFSLVASWQARAVTYTYIGTGDPTLTSNWSPVPPNFNGATDVFLIDASTATLTSAWTVAGVVFISSDPASALTLGSGAVLTVRTLTNDNTLNLDGSTLIFSGGGNYDGAGTTINAINPSAIHVAGNTNVIAGMFLNNQVTLTVNMSTILTLNTNIFLNKLVNNGTIALNDRELYFSDGGGTYTGTGSFTAVNNATPDKIIINNGGGLTLNANMTIPLGATFEVLSGGTLIFGSATTLITGAGAFDLKADGSIHINHVQGLGNGTDGQIQTNTRTYHTGTNFTFSGTSGQFIGSDFPASVKSLTSNVSGAGVLRTNKPTISITGSFSQAVGNSLRTDGCDVTFEFGMTSLSNITLTGGGVSAAGDKIIFNTPLAGGKTLAFSPNGVNNSLGLLEVNISDGNVLHLGSNLAFSPDVESVQLQIVSGKINLNSHNILLLGGAIMQEGSGGVINDGNAANDAIVFDATATDQTNQGGYIQIGNGTDLDFIIDGSGAPTFSNFQGIGLTITDDAGGLTTEIDQVRRYHYAVKHGANGAGVSFGLKRIFRIVGTVPTAPSGTTLEIKYADSDLVLPTGTFSETQNVHISRWTVGGGWESFKVGATVVNSSTTLNASANTINITNIPGFSDWTVSGNAYAPLPITLRTFAVEAVGKDIARLAWTTTSEIDNKGFAIERSFDARNFVDIAFVEGAGNSNQPLAYQYDDANAQSAYYRLKQVDFKGTFSYSPLVYYSAKNNMQVYPNPIADKLYISLPADAQVSVKVYTTHGKLLTEARGQASQVEQTLSKYFDTASKGSYSLQIQHNGQQSIQRLVK